jgi:hypothetical protein
MGNVQKTLLQIITHHRQNSLDFSRSCLLPEQAERQLSIPTAYRDERQVKSAKERSQQVLQGIQLNKDA